MMRFLFRRNLWWRFAGLAALFFVVQYSLGQYVRRSVIRSGEATFGAKVDVGRCRVSLVSGRALLRDLRIANPRSPLQNLVEADACELSFDRNALLHKRTVVRDGKIRGLAFGTSRRDSGELPDDNRDAPSWDDPVDSKMGCVADDWLEQFEGLVEEDVADQLVSVRLADELLAGWPDKYAALRDRIQELHRRTSEFQSQVEYAQANPVRHAEFLEGLAEQIESLRGEYDGLARDVEALPELADADRRAIVAARRNDEQLLLSKLRFQPMDESVLSAYLLEERLAGPVGDLVGWVRWLRQAVPTAPRPSTCVCRRGRDILFTGSQRSPGLLVRSLELEGMACVGGQPLSWTGTLTNLASDPTLLADPMKLALESGGPVPLSLHATIDRAGGNAKDEISFECDGVCVPNALLGKSDTLRLSIAPTTGRLTVHVVLEDNRLSGEMKFAQQEVQIAPHVGGKLNRLPLAAALEDELQDVDSVKTQVTLSGTIDQPEWSLTSTLGPALAKATEGAFRRAAAEHAKQLLAKSRQEVDERLARLDQQIARQQASLLPQLTQSTGVLDQIAAEQDRDKRLSYERLGRRLPAGSLFR